MNTVDARGLDCPLPVIKAKELVEKNCGELSVWVDNGIAASNVTRYLEGQGFSVNRSDRGEYIDIEARRTSVSNQTDAPSAHDSFSILFTSDTIGAESDGLGDVLMKAYLGTLVQKESPPAAIGLMNGGVRMACGETSACDSLSALADRGTRILVCGTCTKHFGITDDIRVGLISNMFEITEAVFGTAKPIVIG